jgi:3D (Asp-Asp-Asp) domain-containing protein
VNKIVTVAALLIFGITLQAGQAALNGKYVATAYNQSGTTASGVQTQRHVVAADPDILPIGSRVKIKHAGRYSGEYVVADTGEKIQGRRLDIYIPSERACRKFGRKQVRVQVVSLGDGTHATTKDAQHAVKQDVQQDLTKKAVGNAATEDDWAAKKAKEAKTSPEAPATSSATPAATAAAPK